MYAATPSSHYLIMGCRQSRTANGIHFSKLKMERRADDSKVHPRMKQCYSVQVLWLLASDALRYDAAKYSFNNG